ncbi:MAG: Fe-S cluster assembly ATPase SufC, partial [Patescibacteria group bacterium]
MKNLKVETDKKELLHGVNLSVKTGEIHVIMGPNGSGKSTLANAIIGHPKYKVKGGKISLEGKNIIGLKADKRAQKGLMLAFQYPKEIPGVSVLSFLQTAANALRKTREQSPISPIEFRKMLRNRLEEFGLDSKFMYRHINEGFSGGEKKKMEMVQMLLLEPKIAIFDEIDSGLDVDALKMIARSIKKFTNRQRAVILITHYNRILRYIVP